MWPYTESKPRQEAVRLGWIPKLDKQCADMSPNPFDNLPVLQKLAGAEDVVISVLFRPQVSENRIVGLGLKACK